MGKISTFVLADCIIFCGKSKYAFCFPGNQFLLKIAMHPVGRQPGDPSGEAALAPLKGELAARTG